MRRYMQTLPCWSISLEVNGIGLLQNSFLSINSFLAINSIEISIIQDCKKLVTKLLDYSSVRGGVIKPGFSEPRFQILALIFIFGCMLSLLYTRIAIKNKNGVKLMNGYGDVEVLKFLMFLILV